VAQVFKIKNLSNGLALDLNGGAGTGDLLNAGNGNKNKFNR
jgi:hypothetical protein